jgi:hypothetical protein
MEIKVLAAILLLAIAAFSETRKCKGNPQVVGACYVVHGRATFGNGTPALRIWPVGTKRMLGVTAAPGAVDADDPICPKNMMRFDSNVEGIFGDFEVCPFTPKRAGSMQMVCVQSATKLFVKRSPSEKR